MTPKKGQKLAPCQLAHLGIISAIPPVQQEAPLHVESNALTGQVGARLAPELEQPRGSLNEFDDDGLCRLGPANSSDALAGVKSHGLNGTGEGSAGRRYGMAQNWNDRSLEALFAHDIVVYRCGLGDARPEDSVWDIRPAHRERGCQYSVGGV